MKKTYDIMGMSCSACSAIIEKVVSRLEGDYLTKDKNEKYSEETDNIKKRAIITSANEIDNELIKNIVEDAGYTVIEIK